MTSLWCIMRQINRSTQPISLFDLHCIREWKVAKLILDISLYHSLILLYCFKILTLAVAANLELANSLWVPLGGLKILPFVTGCLDPMLCLILILLFWDLLMNRGMELTSWIDLCFIQQNLTFMVWKGYQFAFMMVKSSELGLNLMHQSCQASH